MYLTRRETQCAALLLDYKTTKEIGKTLAISPRTAEVYINQLKEKYHARSKIQLIACLLQQKFVSAGSFAEENPIST